jgi:hypothetical protein
MKCNPLNRSAPQILAHGLLLSGREGTDLATARGGLPGRGTWTRTGRNSRLIGRANRRPLQAAKMPKRRRSKVGRPRRSLPSRNLPSALLRRAASSRLARFLLLQHPILSRQNGPSRPIRASTSPCPPNSSGGFFLGKTQRVRSDSLARKLKIAFDKPAPLGGDNSTASPFSAA